MFQQLCNALRATGGSAESSLARHMLAQAIADAARPARTIPAANQNWPGWRKEREFRLLIETEIARREALEWITGVKMCWKDLADVVEYDNEDAGDGLTFDECAEIAGFGNPRILRDTLRGLLEDFGRLNRTTVNISFEAAMQSEMLRSIAYADVPRRSEMMRNIVSRIKSQNRACAAASYDVHS